MVTTLLVAWITVFSIAWIPTIHAITTETDMDKSPFFSDPDIHELQTNKEKNLECMPERRRQIPVRPKFIGGHLKAKAPMPYMQCNMKHGLIANGQLNEDIKMYKRFFRDPKYMGKGVFVEMGGLDGVSISNSYIFEQCLGWSGMLLEANPENFKNMVHNRPCDTNKWCAACSGDQNYLYITNHHGKSRVIHSLEEFEDIKARHQNEYSWHNLTSFTRTPCCNMADVFAEHNITWIDFFSLDVEGSEIDVLRSIDWSKVHVEVMIVETAKHIEGKGIEGRNKDDEVEKVLTEQAGMIRLPTSATGIPQCQLDRKKLPSGVYNLHMSNLYVAPALRDDICAPG